MHCVHNNTEQCVHILTIQYFKYTVVHCVQLYLLAVYYVHNITVIHYVHNSIHIMYIVITRYIQHKSLFKH